MSKIPDVSETFPKRIPKFDITSAIEESVRKLQSHEEGDYQKLDPSFC